MSRTIMLRAAVVVGLIAAGVVVYLLVRGDGNGGNTTAQTSSTPARSASPELRELTSLIGQGRRAEYHATYAVSGDLVPEGGKVVIDAWRNGNRIRLDQTRTTKGLVSRTSLFHVGKQLTTCVKAGDEAWRCRSIDDPSGMRENEDPVLGGVEAAFAGKTIAVSTEEIAGYQGRCFEVGGGDSSYEVCVTDDGIPLRNARQTARLELTDLERSVDDGVFEPPARG